MKLTLVAVLLLLFPVVTPALQVQVSPEMFLQLPSSPPSPASDAKLLSITGADRGFASLFGLNGNIWFVRVDPDGTPIDPDGLSLGSTGLTRPMGDMTWTGSRWFAVWATSEGLSTGFIEQSGDVVSRRVTEMPARSWYWGLSAWNGSHGIAGVADFSGAYLAIVSAMGEVGPVIGEVDGQLSAIEPFQDGFVAASRLDDRLRLTSISVEGEIATLAEFSIGGILFDLHPLGDSVAVVTYERAGDLGAVNLFIVQPDGDVAFRNLELRDNLVLRAPIEIIAVESERVALLSGLWPLEYVELSGGMSIRTVVGQVGDPSAEFCCSPLNLKGADIAIHDQRALAAYGVRAGAFELPAGEFHHSVLLDTRESVIPADAVRSPIGNLILAENGDVILDSTTGLRRNRFDEPFDGAIAPAPNGGFLRVWSAEGGLVAQAYSLSGEPATDPVVVSAGRSSAPDVVATNDGYVVVWHDLHGSLPGGGWGSLHGARLDHDLQVGPIVDLSPDLISALEPLIERFGDGFIVAYREGSICTRIICGVTPDLEAEAVLLDGQLNPIRRFVLSADPERAEAPEGVACSDEVCIVTWTSWRPTLAGSMPETDSHVEYRQLDRIALFPTVAIDEPGFYSSSTAVSPLGGSFLVAWNRGANGERDIVGQIAGQSDVFEIATSDQDESSPVLVGRGSVVNVYYSRIIEGVGANLILAKRHVSLPHPRRRPITR